MDGSPPGSPIPGILQARTLEWVAISFSNAWKWKVKMKLLSRVRPSATPWTAAFQAPPSMGFSRQEYWSGLPLPSLTVQGTGVQRQSCWMFCKCEYSRPSRCSVYKLSRNKHKKSASNKSKVQPSWWLLVHMRKVKWNTGLSSFPL